MRNLDKNELQNITGGYEPKWYEIAAFMAGDMAGRALDFAHGFFDGLFGVEH
ncbi:bacteriocin [Eudoraea sp.]|uniref:bacteriocin n=1 Tax=Eudoraea sp. TaxID=1979955 RepID=UPI003C7434E3